MSRPHYTTPVSRVERSDCEALIRLALAEDAPHGDVTSESIFPPDQPGRGALRAREPGILCGLPVVRTVLEVDAEMRTSSAASGSGRSSPDRVSLEAPLQEGHAFAAGEAIGTLVGPLVTLLRLERVILNFLQYLSGISTVVARTVAEAGDRVHVLDTRKTLPGYRRLAKYAVFCGGGVNHRIHLSDMAMIKDNHIAGAGSIRRAVEAIRARHPEAGLEIEIDRFDQIHEALECRPRVLLLDNLRGPELERCVVHVSRLPAEHRPFIELSGGWKPDELRALKLPLAVGVSMGFLTHTTRFLDIGLDLEIPTDI